MKILKKLSIVFILVFSTALLFAACSAQEPAEKELAELVESTPTPLETHTPEPTPLPETLPLMGKQVSTNAEEVDLRGLIDAKVKKTAEELEAFPNIKAVILGNDTDNPLRWQSICKLGESCPNAVFDYEFTLYDKSFNLSDEEMDLKYIRIEDEGALVKSITSCMRNLKTLDMDSCTISDEKMAELRDSLPNTEVIWRIKFGDYYSVRTNVEKILASMPGQGGELVHNNVESLKYCTKVKYLDLGHNNYLDTIEFTSYMPELEVLIVGMTFVEDFYPLVNCPKLEYIEAMSSRVHDLRPFAELKNLKHLNICYGFAVRDITPLYGLTQLERLWLGKYNPIPPEQLETIKKLLPNCEINDTVEDPTNGGWRMQQYSTDGFPHYAERFALLREQFGYEETDFAFYWMDPLFKYGLGFPVFGEDVERPFTDI